MTTKARNWTEVSVDTDNSVWDKELPIEGEFVKLERDVGPNKSLMYTIKTDDGEVKVWGSTVLDDKLMGIVVGTYVRIEYEGKVTSKKGTSYHDSKVFIDEDSVPEQGVIEAKDEEIKLEDIPF